MEVERMTPERVTVSLSYSEAVVLFDLLHRWEDEGVVQRDALFDDHAERRVLWD